MICILAHGGASSGDGPERRSGEWRPAAAARNRGLGRSGTPPARHEDLAARSSLHGSGGNAGDGSAAPGRKSPRWSAERRASRVMGRAAPHRRGSSRLANATNEIVRLSALRPPLQGDGRDHKDTTRAQQRAAGTKKPALFDIVNRDDGQRFASRAATSHARVPGARSETRQLLCLLSRHVGFPVRMMALRMIRSFLATAMRASFAGLRPVAALRRRP